MEIHCLNSNGINSYEKEANIRLKNALPDTWKSYSSLEIIDKKNGNFECDLIIVTHDRLLVVELKNYSGELFCINGEWIAQFGTYQEPRKHAVNQAFRARNLLEKKINEKLKHRLKSLPIINPLVINHCVILCGTANKDNLPPEQKDYIFSLSEFEAIKDISVYDRSFKRLWNPPRNRTERPNNHIDLWDKFFIYNNVDFRPKRFSVNGFAVLGPAIFKHKDDIYSEFESQKKDDKNYKALMRRWDFTAKNIVDHALTPQDRQLIAQRESKVLGYIDNQDNELKQIHLNIIPYEADVTVDYVELFEWPSHKKRLNEFMMSDGLRLAEEARIDLAQVLLSQLSRLHVIEVAHRDIGEHSVWIGLPSKIQFSNFVTASYPDPDKLTVKSIHKVLKNGHIVIPEDFLEDSVGTKYTRDVYLAAAAVHLILYGNWPKVSDAGIYEWELADDDLYNGLFDEWFSKALDLEAGARFQNLVQALSSFNDLIERIRPLPDSSLTQFSPFYTDRVPYTSYMDRGLKPIGTPKGTCSLYKASDDSVGIKIWHGISDSSKEFPINYQLLTFLTKLHTIRQADLLCLPKIIEFGYNSTARMLFFVYEWLTGQTWEEWTNSLREDQFEDARPQMQELLWSLTSLHNNKIFHGDLHPHNVIVSNNRGEARPVFIDFITYGSDERNLYNTNYVPENYDSISIQSRDRFAIVKMIYELANKFNSVHLVSHCNTLLEQPEISEGDFTRLTDEFESILDPAPPAEIKTFVVECKHFQPEDSIEVETEDGKIYSKAQIFSDKFGTQVRLEVAGPRQLLEIVINHATRTITSMKLKSLSHKQFMDSKKHADLEIECQLTIKKSENRLAVDLLNHILDSQNFKDKWELHQALQQNKLPEDSEAISYVDSDDSIRHEPIRKIWSVLVETEQENFPKALVISEPKQLPNSDVLLYVSSENMQIDFNLDNERVTIKLDVNDETRHIGWVKELGKDVIKFKPKGWLIPAAGNTIRLEGSLAASSLVKRKKAIDAVINNHSVISNLPDYFDPAINVSPSKILEEPSDSELDMYNVYDDSGKQVFGLNDSQRKAFKILYSQGPIGLLQGPPGTGKTAFISSFIHYAITKGAKHVLLVSQSHEALDNAAEMVKSLFAKIGGEISIVRLGDEGKVSDALLAVQETSLQDHYREKFRASIEKRIGKAASKLGLPNSFLEPMIRFEVTFGKEISELISQIKFHESGGHLKDKNLSDEITKETTLAREKRLKEKLTDLSQDLLGIQLNFNEVSLSELRDLVLDVQAKKYAVNSPLLIEKFKQILFVATEWISVMSSRNSQFQNFLTKTRTLVCGTCVGVGRNNYGLDENIYDLVVIDEAARSSASEMAIPMLVGKKVLLVGDHKQLPPIMEEAQIKEAQRKLPGVSLDQLKKSDFERSFLSPYGEKIGQTLSVQYRMAPPIGNLVSGCFYKNILKTGRGNVISCIEAIPKHLGTTVTWLDTSSAGHLAYESRPHGKGVKGTSWINDFEAKAIQTLLQRLVDLPELQEYFAEDDSTKVGIICMYAEQRKNLVKRLNSLEWSSYLLDKRKIKVDTVDSYQGKENPIVIVSLVRNNANYNHGFLYSEHRANVAVSRAKERLYIVGSTDMWRDKNSEHAFGRILKYIEQGNPSEYSVIKALNE